MIDDGYTKDFKGVPYRSLTAEGRRQADRLFNREGVDSLIEFLSSSPRTFGSFDSEDHQGQLYRLVMENPDEDEDAENLSVGIELLLKHPLLGLRSCEVCQEFWFDEETGLVSEGEDGPRKRIPQAKVACETNIGCMRGHHESPIELSLKNKQTWEFYLARRHAGLTDEERQCSVLQKNWRIIGTLIEQHGLPKFYR